MCAPIMRSYDLPLMATRRNHVLLKFAFAFSEYRKSTEQILQVLFYYDVILATLFDKDIFFCAGYMHKPRFI